MTNTGKYAMAQTASITAHLNDLTARPRSEQVAAVRRCARIDWMDGDDHSAIYAHDSGLYYAYLDHQKMLTARMRRGENDGYEG